MSYNFRQEQLPQNRLSVDPAAMPFGLTIPSGSSDFTFSALPMDLQSRLDRSEERYKKLSLEHEELLGQNSGLKAENDA
ncbi:hypothetical protein LTS18_004790, partial [Coniosporium uncinatum]